MSLTVLIRLLFVVALCGGVGESAAAQGEADAQERASITKVGRFLTPADTFDRQRFRLSAGAAAGIYAGFSVGLWQAWYKGYELEGFHTFDDRGEWIGMDKLGHSYTAYHYARWAHQGLQWSGVRPTRAVGLAVGVSTVLQSTVEVMDGFSSEWGFSWSDVAMNALGAGGFAGQELLWGEQRVNVKMSSWRVDHSTAPLLPVSESGTATSLAERAAELYGTTPWQRFIKDYNAQTLWLTANPDLLLGRDEPRLPWLNLAFGYSVDNVYGAQGNTWRANGQRYRPGDLAPRQREYVLSLDIDFERIPTRSPALKTLLHLVNHFKVPAPAIVLRGQEGLQARWLYY